MAENASHEMEIIAGDTNVEQRENEEVKKEKGREMQKNEGETAVEKRTNDRPPTDNLKKLIKKLLYGGRGGRVRVRGRGRGGHGGGRGQGSMRDDGRRDWRGGKRGRRGRKTVNLTNNYKFLL
ncbi:uncharacterized protein LOC105663522 [Megachile rotundata]|uniref:uncharacterized protein LOC105663522 n=1 Tax=Megachile rotundata TaxID=143995 RepID=UPI000614DE30|nr:PREDICTED: replication factor C subunit 1-like [Megachile rotundata]